MTHKIKLTIGIPSIPSREERFLKPLVKKLTDQIGERQDIQILIINDNKKMSVGKKREALFNSASGRYCCIIDDDDDVMDNFIAVLDKAITPDLDVDVICYNQETLHQGRVWTIKPSLLHKIEPPFDPLQDDEDGTPIPCLRPPWHWCTWKTEFVKSIPFPDINWGEDAIFVQHACQQAKTQLIIDQTLCQYRDDPTVSETEYDPNLN